MGRLSGFHHIALSFVANSLATHHTKMSLVGFKLLFYLCIYLFIIFFVFCLFVRMFCVSVFVLFCLFLLDFFFFFFFCSLKKKYFKQRQKGLQEYSLISDN